MNFLFVILCIVMIYNFIQFQKEFKANEDIFSYEYTPIDNILDKNLRVNISIDRFGLNKSRDVYLYGQLVEKRDLDRDRCYYMYPLIHRWYVKYFTGPLFILALMIILKILFYYIDFEKVIKNEDKL